MQQYRLKFILEDGRKVYATKKGKIETSTEEALIRVSRTSKDCAYAKDLSLFAQASFFESQGRDCVRVVDSVIEPAFLSIDDEAIIPGKE